MLKGRRVALIDDAISAGSLIAAGLALLNTADQTPIAIGAAMLQTARWQEALAGLAVEGALNSPLLVAEGEGWSLAKDQSRLDPS